MYFRMIIETNLYEEECSLDNGYHSHGEEYNVKIVSFTYYTQNKQVLSL